MVSSALGKIIRISGRVFAFAFIAPVLAAQQTGTISGQVTRSDDGLPLYGVIVSVQPANLSAVTNSSGRFVVSGVPPGEQNVRARWLAFRPREARVTVGAGQTRTVDLTLDPLPLLLSEVTVSTPSRDPQQLLRAPAAVATVNPIVAREFSATSQVPLALASLTGVDVAQSGINEFNVNTRGFNALLSRRVLVLQDGRDLAIAFLGSQEWTAMSVPLEDMASLEFVRGPGSALYGANAFSGVLSMTTFAPSEILGTKISLAAGSPLALRMDLRHAGTAASQRIAYKVNVGYSQSESWTRSRTNLGDLEREYGEAIDTTKHPIVAPFPGFELRPLLGQTTSAPFGTPGSATGDPDPVTSLYGSARADYHLRGGAVATAEAGAALVKNEVFITPLGRAQVLEAVRPFARLGYKAASYNLMAWFSGRQSLEPQYSLASGGRLEEMSNIAHVEGQLNRHLLNDRVHLVLGASARSTYADSRGTFLSAADDKRTDGYYSAYGQLEYNLVPTVRLVAAARWDDGNLFEHQISPRGALVYSPAKSHTLSLTVGRAFQTPNTVNYLLTQPAGPPADLSGIEGALRASTLGPALANVPDGALFTTSSQVPLWALGNRSLNVETVNNVELGYKGAMGTRVFVTADAYSGRITDFVTDLLPGVNANFAPWTAPSEVPAESRAAVEDAVRSTLIAGGAGFVAAGLTRLTDGSSAVVLSYGNAGRATEKGIEVSATVTLSAGLTVEGNYSYFDARVTELAPGQQVLPNTPHSKGNIIVAYRRQRFDARAGARLVEAFDFAGGIYAGRIPASQTIDLSAGYDISSSFRVQFTGTNILDQRRYQMFGGSLIGRRVFLGITQSF